MSHTHSNNCFDCSLCPRFDESVFNGLSANILGEIDDIKKVLKYKKSSLIFREGTMPKGLYCIRSGKVKLMQMSVDGNDQIIRMLKNGDVLGHYDIFCNEVYTSSAKVIEDAEICFFPRNLFCNLVESNGKLILKFTQLLATDLKEAEKRIAFRAQQSVMVRIAACLILLKDKYGVDSKTHVLNIRITREDLAKMSGTTRETATRCLYKLKDMGVVQLSGKNILISDDKKLINLSE
jgi:CRP/FNR family transcriptional regulator